MIVDCAQLHTCLRLIGVCYDYSVKDGNVDTSSWFASEKPPLYEKNSLINLPYVMDGDKVISQTNACFSYLGRKLNMLGKDENELCQCEQLLCEIMDLRNKVVNHVYSPDGAHADKTKDFLSSITGHLKKLNACFLIDSETLFLVGNSATAPDFHLW